MAHHVVHFEIMGTDGEKLRRFYGDLFGWTFETMEGMDYGTTTPDQTGVGSGIGGDPSGSGMVTVYVGVDDPQAFLDKIVGMGGEVVQPVTEIPDIVTFAQFRDPQGNVVGLVKNQPGA